MISFDFDGICCPEKVGAVNFSSRLHEGQIVVASVLPLHLEGLLVNECVLLSSRQVASGRSYRSVLQIRCGLLDTALLLHLKGAQGNM